MQRRLIIKVAKEKKNPDNFWISTGYDMDMSVNFAIGYKRNGILLDYDDLF